MLNVDELKRLIAAERDLASRDVETYPAWVVDVHKGIATLELEPGRAMLFHPGDPVGVETSGGLRFLGVVLDSWVGSLTVILDREAGIPEDGGSVAVFDYEPLIGYDLQLRMLECMGGGTCVGVDVGNHGAIKLFQESPSLGDLRFRGVGDARDVRGGFELDQSQLRAVEAALALERDELLLVVGPPGTGKTRVIAKIAYELSRRGEKVLIASHTNRAVDNAVELLPQGGALRVGRPEKILDPVKPYLLGTRAREEAGERLLRLEEEIKKRVELLREFIGYLREAKVGGKEVDREKYARIVKKIKDELAGLNRERSELIKMALEDLIRGARVIGSTLVKSQLPPLREVRFDAVIIDEASQASIPLALLAMVKGDKWVVVGDHKQLPPIFRSAGSDVILEDLSAFTSLMKRYPRRTLWLENHYRSNCEIIAFAAEKIYGGRIRPAPGCGDKKLRLQCRPRYGYLDPDKPMVFMHVDGSEAFDAASKSRYNDEEVRAAVEVVRELCACGLSWESIGVIAPYRAQRDRIAGELERSGYRAEVGTVDSFQGREKDVVVFSVVATSRSGLSFASEEHRFNVAITRAKYKLIVIGNGRAIYRGAKDTLLYELLKYTLKLKSIWSYTEQNWMVI